MTISPLNGWLLEAVAELDTHHPGIAGHVLRASSERRQVVAALLSRRATKTYSAEVGAFLTTATHDDILLEAFGSPVPGLRSALSRAKLIQPRRFYSYLAALLSTRSRRSSATTIQRMHRVNVKRLAIMRALPDDLRLPGLIDCLRNVEQARDVARVITMFERNGPSRADMIRAIRTVDTPIALTEFTFRWSSKLDLPDHPVPSSDQYHPVVSGQQLAEVGRRYRNCVRRYLAAALDEKSAFAEFVDEAGCAIIHLRKRYGVWAVEGVHGLENGPVSSAVRDAAFRYLANHGIRKERCDGSPSSPWLPLRRLAGDFRFDDDF